MESKKEKSKNSRPEKEITVTVEPNKTLEKIEKYIHLYFDSNKK